MSHRGDQLIVRRDGHGWYTARFAGEGVGVWFQCPLAAAWFALVQAKRQRGIAPFIDARLGRGDA
jgi:hypothetical protein